MTLIFGMSFNAFNDGLTGILFSITGFGLGIGFLVIFYVLGGMGAGDVKFMGAIGSLLGPKGIFWAFLYTAIIGGVFSFFCLIKIRQLRITIERYANIMKTAVTTGRLLYQPPEKTVQDVKLSYGVAIALGTVFSILFKKYQ
jgi:prepilin peptidase CpaA